MYAIIADGPRQYKVEEGQEIQIDYRDLAPGNQLQFDKVLAVRDEVGIRLGQPALAGTAVTAEVLGPELGNKLVVQKLRRRKNARRKTGHRQLYTRVRIGNIQT